MVKLVRRGLLLLALVGCGQKPAARLASPSAWRADLQYLAAELPSRHARAFHSINRERFGFAVSDLDAAIPKMDDDQVLVGLMRLVALIGDGHTHLDLPPNWPRFPVELAWFGSELRVVGAAGSQAGALGARVVGVGNVSLDSAMVLVSDLVPRGENDRRTRLTATMLLTSPRVLHGLGLSPPGQHAAFTLVTNSGATITETVAAVPPLDFATWHLATEQPPLWLHRLDEPWWLEVLPDNRTLYLSFSGYPAPAEFQQRSMELGHLIDQSGIRRVVIDFRRNEGGDLTLFRRFLLPMLQARRALDRRGSVYAIIGTGTFSAAMVNALDLRLQMRATLVGEPTGGRPNSYSEHADFPLPNSGLRVSYSTQYYRFGADTARAVEPDHRIEPTWQDFRAGRDPVLEWILAQPVG